MLGIILSTIDTDPFNLMIAQVGASCKCPSKCSSPCHNTCWVTLNTATRSEGKKKTQSWEGEEKSGNLTSGDLSWEKRKRAMCSLGPRAGAGVISLTGTPGQNNWQRTRWRRTQGLTPFSISEAVRCHLDSLSEKWRFHHTTEKIRCTF